MGGGSGMSLATVTTCTREEALTITDRIKVGVDGVWDLIKEAYEIRAWAALDYSSWDDYCASEFGATRLRLPREERQEVVASLRESGLSTRAIAAATGVGQTTVRRVLGSGEPNGSPDNGDDDEPEDDEPAPVTGIDGKRYKPTKLTKPTKTTNRLLGLTGEIEWYTPRHYLDAAVEVMGSIELDPASSAAAQQHVRAERWFTLADDGLAQPWSGTVFLNPPYAMPAIKQFVNKLVDSFTAGDVSEAILLTNNATDTEWFHTAAGACTGVCFTRGRISFLQARDGELLEKCSPTHGQAFFYFGPNLRGFKAVFSAFGMTLRRAA
jgi:phage N-6-adenine-methyltransferase